MGFDPDVLEKARLLSEQMEARLEARWAEEPDGRKHGPDPEFEDLLEQFTHTLWPAPPVSVQPAAEGPLELPDATGDEPRCSYKGCLKRGDTLLPTGGRHEGTVQSKRLCALHREEVGGALERVSRVMQDLAFRIMVSELNPHLRGNPTELEAALRVPDDRGSQHGRSNPKGETE